MKNKLYKQILACVFTLSVIGMSGAAFANCEWVPAHWRHGVWVPAQKVCGHGQYYRNHQQTRCKWVNGYWKRGVWHPAQKVCWR